MPSDASRAVIAGVLTACSIAPTRAFLASSGIPAGAKKAEPDAEQFLLIAELAHRRDVDKLGEPARGDEAPERPRLDVGAQRAERKHDAFDLLSAQGDDGGGSAGIGNRRELRARERIDRLHAEVTDGAGAGVTDAHLARPALRVLDQLREGLVRGVAAHDEHARRARGGAERHQVPERVVADRLRVENGTKGERAVLREQDRVRVLPGLDDAGRADGAPGAGTIDREHRRLQQPRDLFAQGARGDVRGVPRGKRDDEADRAGRGTAGPGRRPAAR